MAQTVTVFIPLATISPSYCLMVNLTKLIASCDANAVVAAGIIGYSVMRVCDLLLAVSHKL